MKLNIGQVMVDPFAGTMNFSMHAADGAGNLNFNGKLPDTGTKASDQKAIVKAAAKSILTDALAAVEAL